MVFELNADLPLVGLVSDEGVLQQLLCRGPLSVVLHQTALDKAKKLFGPEAIVEEERGRRVNRDKQCKTERVTHKKRQWVPDKYFSHERIEHIQGS